MATTIENENTRAIAELTTAVATLTTNLSNETALRISGDSARPTSETVTAAIAAEATARDTAIATAVNALKLTGTYDLKTNDDVYNLLAALARKLGATVNE